MTERKSLTTVFTMRKADVGHARQELDVIDQGFLRRFDAKDAADAVYCLSVQLFKIADKTR